MKNKKLLSIMLITLMCFIASPVYASRVSCGNITGLPGILPRVFSYFIIIIKVVVPVILVITGMIDFAKTAASNKDDAMGSGLKIFLNRLILGALIFLIVSLAQLVIRIAADGKSKNGKQSDANNIIDCLNCFTRNDCKKYEG